jgi:hypothetical protein
MKKLEKTTRENNKKRPSDELRYEYDLVTIDMWHEKNLEVKNKLSEERDLIDEELASRNYTW